MKKQIPVIPRSLLPKTIGEETTTVRGTTLEYGIQVGMNGDEFDADTIAEALAKVREWRDTSKETDIDRKQAGDY